MPHDANEPFPPLPRRAALSHDLPDHALRVGPVLRHHTWQQGRARVALSSGRDAWRRRDGHSLGHGTHRVPRNLISRDNRGTFASRRRCVRRVAQIDQAGAYVMLTLLVWVGVTGGEPIARLVLLLAGAAP